MTYSNNIPQSSQSLGITQPLVLNNFSLLQTAFSANHGAISSTNQGKHSFLQMPSQATSLNGLPVPVSPAITTLINEGGFYTETVTTAGPPATSFVNLLYQAQSNGKQYLLTAVDDGNFTEFGTNGVYNSTGANYSGGWTFLPGGLLLQYGSVSVTTSNFPILFPKTFSATPFAAFIQQYTGGTSATANYVVNGSLNMTQMQVFIDTRPRIIFWAVIGPS